MKRTLAEIANLINGKLCGDYDENLVITGATGIALAGPSEITFAVDPHLEEAIACNAAAVIIQEDVDGFSKTCIKVKNPREAFNILLNIFKPELKVLIPLKSVSSILFMKLCFYYNKGKFI